MVEAVSVVVCFQACADSVNVFFAVEVGPIMSREFLGISSCVHAAAYIKPLAEPSCP